MDNDGGDTNDCSVGRDESDPTAIGVGSRDLGGSGGPPEPPELPAYVLEPLERQPPDRLDSVAEYASELADWKRTNSRSNTPGNTSNTVSDTSNPEGDTTLASEESRTKPVSEAEIEGLKARDVSINPEDYESVPQRGAYITIKETKPGYRYYYWQWRDGDSWKNAYIAPVETNSTQNTNNR